MSSSLVATKSASNGLAVALLIAVILLSAWASATHAAPAQLRLTASAHAPHSYIIKRLGWAEDAYRADGSQVVWVQGADADFKVQSGAAALKARLDGQALNAVLVTARDGSNFHVLTAPAAWVESEAPTVSLLIALYERARRYAANNPAEAARLIAEESGLSLVAAQALLQKDGLALSRPGPAQAQQLRQGLPSAQLAQVDALLADGPARAAYRRIESQAPGALASLGW
jgi:ABC-type nitrate/sulfonate/bicarbonate transport system substrate-binding protein